MMNKDVSILENLIYEAHQLEKAVNETIEENLHLADGDNCTLFKLKRAVSGESDRVDDLRDEQIEEILMPLIISLQEYSPTAHNGDAVGKTAVLEELEKLRAWINETPE